LRVLQEAVASAVHELSQPLNVVNLLADNALDDVATLTTVAGIDSEVLAGLRRRVEAIAEHAGKASDITRWIRAFAVGIGAPQSDFDPDPVIARIVGLFANDLDVAGIRLSYEPAADRGFVAGDEPLLAFALTEAILWMCRTLPTPELKDQADGTTGREIHVHCRCDPAARLAVVTLSGRVVAAADAPPAAAPSAGGDPLPAELPLIARAARAPGSSVAFARTPGAGLQLSLSMPFATAPLV
jgi:hypothetical protein